MVMIIYSSLERGTLRKTAKTLARTAEADHIGCCSPENPPDHFKEIHRMARKQAPDMPLLPGFETAVRDAALAAARDRAALRRLLRRGLALSTLVALLFLLVLAVLGEWLLRLVGGAEAGGAYQVMLLLAAAASISFAGFALEPLLVSMERHGLALRLRAIATAVYVPLALAGLAWLGLPGAGVASILSALLLLAGQAMPAMQWLSTPARSTGKGNLH